MDDQSLGKVPGPVDPSSSAPPPPPPPGMFPDPARPAPAAPAGPPTAPTAADPTAAPQPAEEAAGASEPAPAPQRGAYPQATPEVGPAARPRKKRGCLIAAIVTIVVLCALCGIGGVIFAVFSGGGDSAKITQAELHYRAAASAVTTATAELRKAGSGSGRANTARGIAGANQTLRTARDELAASRAAIEQIASSPGKTDYLASLAAATKSVSSLEDVVAYLSTETEMMGRVTEAGRAADKANKTLSMAIQSGNAKNYALMKSRALSAAPVFIKSAVVFREAAKLDKSAGLDKAALFVDKRRRQADIIVLMAGYGASGNVAAYNREIARIGVIDKEAAAIGDPAIITDPDWAKKRLTALGIPSTEAAAKSDELHAKALKELKYAK